jgi:hypothetical protein
MLARHDRRGAKGNNGCLGPSHASAVGLPQAPASAANGSMKTVPRNSYRAKSANDFKPGEFPREKVKSPK